MIIVICQESCHYKIAANLVETEPARIHSFDKSPSFNTGEIIVYTVYVRKFKLSQASE